MLRQVISKWGEPAASTIQSAFEERELMVLAAAVVALIYATRSARQSRAQTPSQLLNLALTALVLGLIITNIEAGATGPFALGLNLGEHAAYLLHSLLLGWYLVGDGKRERS